MSTRDGPGWERSGSYADDRILMSQAPVKIGLMKTMTGISAMTLLLSVGALDSSGVWWVVALVAALCSVLALFYMCSRQGLFVPIRQRRLVASVFSLQDARANARSTAMHRGFDVAAAPRESITARQGR